MAESWESNLLYWADVGDQTGVQPAQLNVLVPEWTRRWWSGFSPRISKTGRRCCAACARWAKSSKAESIAEGPAASKHGALANRNERRIGELMISWR